MAMEQEKKSRVIKRYANRKLYDTEDSRYVTLEEIASLVKADQDVKIIDNRSGEDLTEVTLAQILFEEQKKQKTRMPLTLLRDLISTSGETISEFIQRRVTQPVQSFKEEAERKVDEIVRLSESTVEGKARQIREFFNHTHQSLDEIQKRFDGRIQALLATVPGVRTQLETLRKKIEDLEARLSMAESEQTTQDQSPTQEQPPPKPPSTES